MTLIIAEGVVLEIRSSEVEAVDDGETRRFRFAKHDDGSVTISELLDEKDETYDDKVTVDLPASVVPILCEWLKL